MADAKDDQPAGSEPHGWDRATMRELHLDAALLERALDGDLEPGYLVRRLLYHLLALCPRCRRTWERVVSEGSDSEEDGEGGAGGGLYAEAFARAMRAVRARRRDLAAEVAAAPERMAELIRLPADRREAHIRNEARFHTWGVADLLICRSREAAFEDPQIASTLAHLAVFVAERMRPEVYGAGFRRDVLALAWSYLGNARRVASDLRGAAEALKIAEEHLAEGMGEPLTRAEVLTLRASLSLSRRRFEEARCLLDEVTALYRSVRDPQLEGQTLVKRAECEREAGEAAAAVPLLRRALALVDPEHDPRLYLCAYHNLAASLLNLGQLEEAEKVLEEARPFYEPFGDFSTRLRLRWLEGQLAAARDLLEEAEAAFLEVREGFVEREVGYDAALVSLDLAGLYLSQGRHDDVRDLAEEILSIFHSRDVHREALAALLIFQRAAREKEVTVRMLEQIAAYLRRARRDPELRYEEPS